MEWYGEDMLPRGLPELVYQASPWDITRRMKVISYNRKKARRLQGQVRWENSSVRIALFPTVILANGCSGLDEAGVESFRLWLTFLRVMLHEIGHVVTGNSYLNHFLYETDAEYKMVVENRAELWAQRKLELIKERHPRAGQPVGWIGGLPGLYLLKRSHFSETYGAFEANRIANIRALRCQGQLTLTHAIQTFLVKDLHMWCWGIPKGRAKLRSLAKRLAPDLGITRTFVDNAGREHLFFNNGEARLLQRELTEAVLKNGMFWDLKREEQAGTEKRSAPFLPENRVHPGQLELFPELLPDWDIPF